MYGCVTTVSLKNKIKFFEVKLIKSKAKNL